MVSHVRQDGMLRPMEGFHAVDGEEVRGDALNLRPHAVQQVAELLHVRLARGVVDDRAPLGQHRGHDDVGRARHRSLVQQHVGAPQAFGLNLVSVAVGVVVEVGAQLLDADEVRVQPPAANLVASGFGDDGAPEAGHQRPCQHHRAAQAGARLQESLALQVVQVHVRGLEAVGVRAFLGHPHAHVAQQLDEVVHVEDVGHVAHHHLVRREQCRADDLQRLVLGALRADFPAQLVSSFDDE